MQTIKRLLLGAVVSVFLFSVSWAERSDVRYKKNARPLPGDLMSKVLSLRAVEFEWNLAADPEIHLPGGTHIGLVAQDVAQQFPDLVYPDGKDSLAVDYARLGVVLLEAIKIQQTKIENLEKDVKALQAGRK